MEVKKNIRKTLFSLAWILFIAIMFYLKQGNMGYLFASILLALAPWIVDINKLSSLSLDLHNKKVLITQALQETEQTSEDLRKIAKEVEVTAEDFSKTINSFLKFNMLGLQREGRLDMNTPWYESAQFVEEAKMLYRLMDNSDDLTEQLLQDSQCKVIELFKLDVTNYIPEDKKTDFDKAISTGIYLNKNLVKLYFNKKEAAINFEILYSLGDSVENTLQAQYFKNVNKLEQYYNDNFS